MDPRDAITLIALLGIAALVACLAYALRDTDTPAIESWSSADLLPVDPYQPDQRGTH